MSTLAVQPMSGGQNPAYREPLSQLMQPSSARVTAATVRTMSPEAVQQMRAPEKGAQAALKPVATPKSKRGELVGPPPSFEVNVLQHLRESRDTSASESESDSVVERNDASAAPVNFQGYDEFAGLAGQDGVSTGSEHVDLTM